MSKPKHIKQMKLPSKKFPFAAQIAALTAALAAVVTSSQAQVTFSQVTNGLVSWYPLDFVVTNGTTLTTPDYIGGRDLILSPAATGNNVVHSTRPSQNSATVSNCFNLNQSGGATVLYYNSKGQNPLTGGGDFLPFCNQVNASLNFWIKSINTSGFNDSRFFGECDTTGGQAGPIWLWGTSSAGGLSTDKSVHFLFRQKNGSGGAAIADPLVDGTFDVPNINNYWVQGNSYTSNSILDGTWHMVTAVIESNRVLDVYMDGVRDPGPPGPAFTDANGNPNYGPDMPLTNLYYTTNIYPSAGVSNPPPNGFVRWVWNATFKTGSTTFGGFKRGGITGGLPAQFDDIGFWNRQLSTNEIAYLFTNGLTGISINRPLLINSFTADFAEVGQGDTVTLRWNLTGASTNTGGIVISGVGDVSSKGLIGSTNVTLNGQSATFTITAHNGVVPNVASSVTVQAFSGVVSTWHLIQRFDGVFADDFNDVQGGVNGNSWISVGSDFSGSFDKWNVVTLTNSGATNKGMSPRTGYNVNSSALSGFESRGALSYGKLGSLAMPPNTTNTLFFRFSLQEPAPSAGLQSDLDFNVGLSDFNFVGPFGGLGYGGNVGPFFTIKRDSGGNFNGAPFSIFARDFDGVTATGTNTFSYTASVDPAGLMTNVNYLVWMDVENYNTHAVTNLDNTTNTLNEAVFRVWLQKQGDSARTLLVTNFHGDRDYVGFNPVVDNPTPTLDKVFFDIGNESFVAAANGSYISTNMIVVDDIYLSKSGANSTIPRLFDITSVVKGTGSVTLTWDSLGSLFGTNTYQIQRKTQLTDANWTVLNTIPSGGSQTTYTDNTVGNAASAFYRIVWP